VFMTSTGMICAPMVVLTSRNERHRLKFHRAPEMRADAVLGPHPNCAPIPLPNLDNIVFAALLSHLDGCKIVSIQKTLSAELCGLKQNRTMICADGGPRKPSVWICLELLPIA
jgi:hypothetical protein